MHRIGLRRIFQFSGDSDDTTTAADVYHPAEEDHARVDVRELQSTRQFSTWHEALDCVVREAKVHNDTAVFNTANRSLKCTIYSQVFPREPRVCQFRIEGQLNTFFGFCSSAGAIFSCGRH